jgi:hypothetical protein
MKQRIAWFTAFLTLMCGLSISANAEKVPALDVGENHTMWTVRAAAGMDALLIIGAVGGDVMQGHIYAGSVAYFRENLSAEGVSAMDQLDAMLRQEMGQLTGPSLAHLFSAGPIATIDDVIASAADPVGRLRPGHEASPGWNEKEFENATRAMPMIHTALIALRDMGYTEWYAREHKEAIDASIAANLAAVSNYDVIPEQEKLLGRTLDPEIEIVVVAFSQPYGIRILGQRFVAYYGYEGKIQLHIAAHEIFHPPYNRDDPELLELLAPLEADPWMTSIVEDHDPQYGYNRFSGIIDEDSTEALDQIVAERLGFAKEARERWRAADGGMHMFAAALYHAMQEDGFAETGGIYEDWLKSALQRDLLSPENVRRRAAEVVGQDMVDAWGPHRSVEAANTH